LFVASLDKFFFFPSAYELYANLSRKNDGLRKKDDKPRKTDKDSLKTDKDPRTTSQKEADKSSELAKHFKNTFSRKDVGVHFLGAWWVSAIIALFMSLTTIETGIPFLPLVQSEERAFLGRMSSMIVSAISGMLSL
jgi:hypothetical protein